MDKRGAVVVNPPGDLRKFSFPECASEALMQVTKHCGQQSRRSTLLQRNQELQHQLDNELFCVDPERRGTRLNALQQLRLLQMLCQFFNEKEKEARGHQYACFEAIFCGREGETLLHESRILLLQKLCSLAVQYPCYPLIEHISQWLHKIGSGRCYAQEIVSYLVDQYILAPASWNVHVCLLPLAEESPEFVSYFVAYSVNIATIQSPLMKVLEHWLTEQQAPKIFSFIKETQIIANFFATQTFGYLVAYDCSVDDVEETALHGVITEMYVDWPASPPLQILPELRVLASENFTVNPDTLAYHVHLAKMRRFLTSKDISEFLDDPEMRSQFSCLQRFVS